MSVCQYKWMELNIEYQNNAPDGQWVLISQIRRPQFHWGECRKRGRMVPDLKGFTNRNEIILPPGRKYQCYRSSVSVKRSWWCSGLQSLCPLILSYIKPCRSPYTSDITFFFFFFFFSAMAFLQMFIVDLYAAILWYQSLDQEQSQRLNIEHETACVQTGPHPGICLGADCWCSYCRRGAHRECAPWPPGGPWFMLLWDPCSFYGWRCPCVTSPQSYKAEESSQFFPTGART